MRKLIWCCSAAGVLATGSFLSLAYYACRCPDSLVGRSMQVIAEASIAMQPLNGLTALAVRTNQANAPAHETAGSIEECIPDDPQPVAPERKEEVVIESHHDVDLDAAPIVIDEEDPMPREEGVAIDDPGPVPMAGMHGQEIPPKGCPIVMPYCRDDDEEPVTPPKMPRADAAEEMEHTVFKAWMELFQEGKEDKEDKSPSVEELPAPTEEEEPQAEPKCQEDSHLHEHYPGCPRTTCPYTRGLDPKIKKKGSEESSEEPRHPGKKPYHDKDECPRTKGVDTMEYRKSDAGLDEYGPGPLH